MSGIETDDGMDDIEVFRRILEMELQYFVDRIFMEPICPLCGDEAEAHPMGFESCDMSNKPGPRGILAALEIMKEADGA